MQTLSYGASRSHRAETSTHDTVLVQAETETEALTAQVRYKRQTEL